MIICLLLYLIFKYKENIYDDLLKNWFEKKIFLYIIYVLKLYFFYSKWIMIYVNMIVVNYKENLSNFIFNG